ncbi:hypothetical protein B0J17DRAFT_631567 [Rhizoctonia solani]|nr:hypothetical protein B0J17DRAFT_631567 [Rhizoctonia solani]
MPTQDINPCPYLDWKEDGAESLIGVIGGSLAYAVKGALSSPKGARMEGAIHALDVESRAQNPATRNFWAWVGLVSAFGCVITSYRRNHDIWTGVFSGAGASGILSANRGPRGALSGALVGASIMGTYGYMAYIYEEYTANSNLLDPTPVWVTHISGNQTFTLTELVG